MKNSMMRWRRFREEVENNYLSTEVLKMAGLRGGGAAPGCGGDKSPWCRSVGVPGVSERCGAPAHSTNTEFLALQGYSKYYGRFQSSVV